MVNRLVYANRYEVEREIARGGMADVSLARDTKLNREVAIKVLSPQLSRDPTFVQRFRAEAQSAAKLNHPNIVAVYDWGQEDGTSFIVMEHVEGKTLRDLAATEGPLTPERIAGMGAEIASALSFAHQAGVVHRDVKPGNVLVTPDGQVKVTDFGIAQADGGASGLTRTGAVMGTATYFSPEQAQGLPVDGRSDIYSLGIVLYELIAGTPPFAADNSIAVASQHVRDSLPSLSERVPEVPADLERIVAICLAKNPSERYQSADELRADLLRFQRHEPVAAGPVTAHVAVISDATTALPVLVGGNATTRAAPERGKGPLVMVIILLVALVAVVGALILSQLGGSKGVARVEVPLVIGDPVEVATANLKAKGFSVVIKRKANDTVPEGLVVAQNPEAGTKADAKSAIELIVSDGVGKVRMPDVDGELFEDAEKKLVDLGLEVLRTDEESADVVAGTVIRTDPVPGKKLAEGSTVTVVVSAGPAPTPVPNVVGETEFNATQTLARAGFIVERSTAASNTVPSGAVISTSPAAGQPAAKESTIKIVVSTGPEQATVPNVGNQSQATATNTLTSAGFNVVVVQVASTADRAGKVITQNPAGGTTVPNGSSVTITVGTGLPTTTTTV
ncbi:MAG: Stk1 family PASTA domain-containing Ser/Thr kinase [Acidimicrobiia bacterium]|nr:Stk1 family PASTA domain-containing Ser/Thr kinase [Acidimicrobiia bacterium]